MRIRVIVPFILSVLGLILTPRPLSAQKLLADGGQDLASQISASVVKEQKRKIAVVPFTELDGRATVLGTFLAEDLTTRLFVAGGFEIVERTLLNKVMTELKLGGSGAIDPDQAKQIGKVAGVDAIVTGSVTDLQSSVAVNCRVIDVQTGRVFGAAQTRIIKDEDVRAIMGRPLGTDGSGGSGVARQNAGPPAALAAPQPAITSQRGDLLFTFRECRRKGSQVSCSFAVTNTGNKGISEHLCGIYLLDSQGLRSQNVSWNMAGVNNSCGGTFEPGLPVAIRLTTDDLSPEARALSVVGNDGVIFRNVPVR